MRCGMRGAAADGAAVPDLVMRHVPDRRHEQRMRRAQPRLVLNVAPMDPGTERDPVVANQNPVETCDLPEIDQHGRRGKAKRQQRHQALLAGNQPCLAGARGEQRLGFVERGRAGVVEGCKLHGVILTHPGENNRHDPASQGWNATCARSAHQPGGGALRLRTAPHHRPFIPSSAIGRVHPELPFRRSLKAARGSDTCVP